MRTNYVLIDYENKPQVDIDAIEKALPGAYVLVFIGTQQKSLPINLVLRVQSLGVRGRYVINTVSGLKNAVDMLMSMTVGELIAEKKDACIHIVSGDQGFKPIIENLKSRGIQAKFLQCESRPEKSANKTARQVVGLFRKSLAAKNGPGTVKKLKNELKTLWGKHEPTEDEFTSVLNNLVLSGTISIDGEKVTYPDKPAK